MTHREPCGRAPNAGPVSRTERKAKKHQSARREFLEAASKLVAERGLEGASMQEIAAEAGYTTPTLYCYFRSKGELFAALVAAIDGELMAALSDPPLLERSLERRLELLLLRLFELADRRRTLLALLLDASGSSGRPRQERADRMRRLYEAAARWVQPAAAGALGCRSEEEVVFFILSLGHASVSLWLQEEDGGRLADRARAMAALAMGGVAGTDRNRPAPRNKEVTKEGCSPPSADG